MARERGQLTGGRVTVKLKQIYETCIKAGAEADAREAAEIDRVLADARKAYDRLEEPEKSLLDRKSVV